MPCAIWQHRLPHLLTAQTRATQKSLPFGKWRFRAKGGQGNGSTAEKDKSKTERATELGRRTREEIIHIEKCHGPNTAKYFIMIIELKSCLDFFRPPPEKTTTTTTSKLAVCLQDRFSAGKC